MRYFRTELQFIVKTYDIDYAGHVSNIVYIRWLEDMRLQMLHNRYPLERLMKEGLCPVLVSTHIKYKQPITLFDSVIGLMGVERLQRMSFSLRAEFRVQDAICSSVEQIIAFISLTTKKLIPIPPPFLKKMKERMTAR